MIRHRRLAGAAVAIGAPAAVSLLALGSFKPIIPALLFVLAIAAAGALGGVFDGLLAGAVSLLSLLVLWEEERSEIGFTGGEELVTAVVFLLVAVGVGGLIERQRRTNETAVAAQAAAEAAATASRRLQRAAEALASAVTPEEVLGAVLRQGVAAAEARAGLIAVLTEDGKELEILAQRGYPEEQLAGWARFPVAGDYPLSYAVRTGEPVFVGSEAERLERFPALPRIDQPTFALVCLPLVVEGRTIGGLTFSFGEDQHFDADRRALKVALARQAAQALDRARVYQALEASERRMWLLARASSILASSLDYELTLGQLVSLTVPELADWAVVDMLDEDGEIRRVAVGHENPARVEWSFELRRRFPIAREADAVIPRVIRTGEPEFEPQVPRELIEREKQAEPEVARAIEELDLSGSICVPLRSHDRVLGALSLAVTGSRTFTEADYELAKAVADRAGAAVSNALLFREAERRGDAARALQYVGDAVVLVDAAGDVRFWNPAAELILERRAADAIGHPAAEVIPGWRLVERHVEPASAGTGELARSATIPVPRRGEDRWLSVAAVDFGEGRVYALRDITEEHALERARSEFVATASHELRTPLAAVYGAVRTLRRRDVEIAPENRELFLEMIESETDRLSTIVGQILVAGQLESDSLRLDETSCDLPTLARGVLAAARVRAPESVSLDLAVPESMPPVVADEDKLRQVLVNLVENAIKYSPDGGEITLELSSSNGLGRIDVRDQGLGIPPQDQSRIFEKFARLDPALTRGVGGTGLGLYIARELVERMGG
ncbi:MAG TPA: GAF domain-containing protein, partial [Gaiellaceae bacterium]|nr:GAF domain-containing protein [Gaiellaceae bacterium]